MAIKVPRLDREDARQKQFVDRFCREARTAAAVRHRFICPIYDAGVDNETPYVVMAFVEGETLADRLQRTGRFEDERCAVALILKVAEALQAVHEQGIVHRDLKPGNILLDARQQPYLTDFGLACHLEGRERLTHEGTVIGTPAYMAPEQVLGGTDAGPVTDLYSLGVVLYEMLAGRLPFEGTAVSIMVSKATRVSPLPLTRFREDLTPSLVAVVKKAVSHNPADRFGSAAEFAEALQRCLPASAADKVEPADDPSEPHAPLASGNSDLGRFQSGPLPCPLFFAPRCVCSSRGLGRGESQDGHLLTWTTRQQTSGSRLRLSDRLPYRSTGNSWSPCPPTRKTKP